MKQYKAIVETKNKKMYSIVSLIMARQFKKVLKVPFNYIYATTLFNLLGKTTKDEKGLYTFNSIC